MAGKAGRLIALALAGAAVGATAATAYDPVQALAGRYSRGFANGMIDGSAYRSEDIAEIVPVDAAHAYVRFELAFFNGHSCSLAGIATRRGATLVYQGLPDDIFGEGAQPCRLTIRRQGAKLVWSDGGTCKGHCGARGGFNGGELPWAGKRAIRYLPRLRASTEYRRALTEWRTGRAAP